MGDAYWGSIKEDKQQIIDNLQEFCNMFGLECPKLDTRMRIDVLRDKSNEIRKNFWNSIKKTEVVKMDNNKKIERLIFKENAEVDLRRAFPDRDIIVVGEARGEELDKIIEAMDIRVNQGKGI